MRLLHARLIVLGGPDDALDRVFQDEVGDLVAGDEGACEGAAVDCDDADFFYGGISAVAVDCEPDFREVCGGVAYCLGRS